MGCLIASFKLLMLPIIFVLYIWWFIILVIWELIKWFLSVVFGTVFNPPSYSYKNTYKNNKPKKKSNKYRDIEFNKQADLWGLSEEDRRIAKQERMSPADFIEAEERDDDELVIINQGLVKI